MTDVKVCADCEYCIPEKFYASQYKCRKTESLHINHITGERNIMYTPCQTERAVGKCGPLGINFVQKTRQDSILYRIKEHILNTSTTVFLAELFFVIGVIYTLLGVIK